MSAEQHALRLAEHLLTRARAAVVDPPISALRNATLSRFRKQSVYFRKYGLAKIKGSLERGAAAPTKGELQAALDTLIHFRAPAFRTAYARQTTAAYSGGAEIALGELKRFVLAEAAKTKAAWLTALSGPRRTAEQLERELDDTTEARLTEVITAGFADGLTLAALSTAVAELYKGWMQGAEGAMSRVDTIALTESAQAFGDGGHDAAAAVKHANPGVEIQKAWNIEPSACEICEGNADDGWIPEDLPFSSGNFWTPAHVNCVCSVSYQSVGGIEE